MAESLGTVLESLQPTDQHWHPITSLRMADLPSCSGLGKVKVRKDSSGLAVRGLGLVPGGLGDVEVAGVRGPRHLQAPQGWLKLCKDD